jgi:hypothetical protein
MASFFQPAAYKDDRELNRLLTAAVVNRKFCDLLLTNPASALARGYQGEAFRLDTEEQKFILSIRANTLADFAQQLAQNPLTTCSYQ